MQVPRPPSKHTTQAERHEECLIQKCMALFEVFAYIKTQGWVYVQQKNVAYVVGRDAHTCT